MLCEGVMLYMMLVTVFGNKLNRRSFLFFLGWGKYAILLNYILRTYNKLCTFIGPAIPIVAISVAIAHKQYGTDY